jgi:uncharacterized protein involved in outer membrane biogenesis
MLGFAGWLFKTAFKIALLIAAVAVMVAYGRLLDTDGLKQALMLQVTGTTGRTLEIDGDFGIDFAFPPRIGVDGVRLKNAPWATRDTMLSMQRLEAELDFLPLVMGDVAVPRVRMIGVDIVYETGPDGRTNWDELADFETAAGPGGGFGGPIFGPILNSGVVTVAGGTLTVVDAASGAETTVSLDGPAVEVAGSGGSGSSGGSSGGSGGGGADPEVVCP